MSQVITREWSAILIWSPFANGLLATVSVNTPVAALYAAPDAEYLAWPTALISIAWSYALSLFALSPLAANDWKLCVNDPPDLIVPLLTAATFALLNVWADVLDETPTLTLNVSLVTLSIVKNLLANGSVGLG